MADHRVFFELPVTELGKADATFKIRKDGKLLGTIYISHGAFEYRPTGRIEKNTIRMDWTKFDKLMKECK